MYRVDLDLILRFVPPMSEIGAGIRLTRSFDLPFPPTEQIAMFSKEWEGHEDPFGFALRRVTLDLDRQRFLAETESSFTGFPIAMIPPRGSPLRELRLGLW